MNVDTGNSIYQYIPSRTTIRDCLPFIGVFTTTSNLLTMFEKREIHKLKDFDETLLQMQHNYKNIFEGLSTAELAVPLTEQRTQRLGELAKINGFTQETVAILDDHIELSTKLKTNSRNGIISNLLTLACSIALYVQSWIFIVVGLGAALIAWKTLPIHWSAYSNEANRIDSIQKHNEAIRKLL